MTIDISVLESRLSHDAYPLEAGLYLVATPIGNLNDFSLRALQVLSGVQRIYCEDTRVTQKLLSAYNIPTPYTSYYDFTPEKKHNRLMAELAAGATFALVSDAGMPLVSDPGFQLVADCRTAGVPVYCIPGASSVLTALVLSTLPPHPFYFGGFLPTAKGEKIRVIEAVKLLPATLIYFETLPRIAATLTLLTEVLGAERRVALCRELTKKFEEVQVATLAEWVSGVATLGAQKGELVVVIEGASSTAEVLDETVVVRLLKEALASGLRVGDAATALQKDTGWARRALYNKALELTDESDDLP